MYGQNSICSGEYRFILLCPVSDIELSAHAGTGGGSSMLSLGGSEVMSWRVAYSTM